MSLSAILSNNANSYNTQVGAVDSTTSQTFPNAATNASLALTITDSSGVVRQTVDQKQSTGSIVSPIGIYTQRLGNVMFVTLRQNGGAVVVPLSEVIQVDYTIPAADRPAAQFNLPCWVTTGGVRSVGVIRVTSAGLIEYGQSSGGAGTTAPIPFVTGTVCGFGGGGGVTFSYPIGAL